MQNWNRIDKIFTINRKANSLPAIRPFCIFCPPRIYFFNNRRYVRINIRRTLNI